MPCCLPPQWGAAIASCGAYYYNRLKNSITYLWLSSISKTQCLMSLTQKLKRRKKTHKEKERKQRIIWHLLPRLWVGGNGGLGGGAHANQIFADQFTLSQPRGQIMPPHFYLPPPPPGFQSWRHPCDLVTICLRCRRRRRRRRRRLLPRGGEVVVVVKSQMRGSQKESFFFSSDDVTCMHSS